MIGWLGGRVAAGAMLVEELDIRQCDSFFHRLESLWLGWFILSRHAHFQALPIALPAISHHDLFVGTNREIVLVERVLCQVRDSHLFIAALLIGTGLLHTLIALRRLLLTYDDGLNRAFHRCGLFQVEWDVIVADLQGVRSEKAALTTLIIVEDFDLQRQDLLLRLIY